MSQDLTVTTEVVTPEMAARYLERNTRNRRIRTRVVDNYARDMRAGRWFAAVEVISFDPEGNLLNGQHTLSAVVTSGVPVSVIVVRNQDPRAQDVMDTGSARKMSDQLYLRGDTNTTTLGAAVRFAYMYSQFGGEFRIARHVTPTHEELFAYLDRNPGIRLAVGATAAVREVGIPQATAAALYYFMAQRNPDLAERFWSRVITGSDIGDGSPIFALRRLLINDLSRGRKMERMLKAAVIIKAWNAERRGGRMKTLVWRDDESFPVIV